MKIVVILNAANLTASSNFSHYRLMMTTMVVRLYFDVHGTLESMAQYINSFDIRDNGISFFVAICDRVHQSYSSKNCNRALDRVE